MIRLNRGHSIVQPLMKHTRINACLYSVPKYKVGASTLLQTQTSELRESLSLEVKLKLATENFQITYSKTDHLQ